MAVDTDEFARLFEPDPVAEVKKVFKVPADDIKPIVLKWKGQELTVYDYGLFKDIIKDWMKRYGKTKDEALDDFFAM